MVGSYPAHRSLEKSMAEPSFEKHDETPTGMKRLSYSVRIANTPAKSRRRTSSTKAEIFCRYVNKSLTGQAPACCRLKRYSAFDNSNHAKCG